MSTSVTNMRLRTASASSRGQKGFEIAPMSLMPVDKCISDASLLAEMRLQKYEYHFPFYRQIQKCQHIGMKGFTEAPWTAGTRRWKNSLFCDTHEVAVNMSVVCSLQATQCKSKGISE